MEEEGGSGTTTDYEGHNNNHNHLALTLDDFDLVLESFLRCQSISTYLSSRPKTEMVYY